MTDPAPPPAEAPAGPTGLGATPICAHADAWRLLNHPQCRREPRTAVITGVLKAAGRDGTALAAISRLNLLNEEGQPHRQKRRFALQVIAEIRAIWEPVAVDRAVRQILDQAAQAGRVDLHRDLSMELACRIVGARLGLPPDQVMALQRLTAPIFESNFRAAPRMADFLALAARADEAAALIGSMVAPAFAGRDIDPQDLPMLAALVTVPAIPLLAEALTQAMLHLLRQPALMAQLRRDTEAIGRFLRETLRRDPPLRYTKPTRTHIAQTLADGSILPAGATFVCDLRSANHDAAQRSRAEPSLDRTQDPADLTFGAGRHRCPGAGLSLVVLKQAVITAITGYEIRVDGDVQAHEALVGRRHQAVPVQVRHLL